MRKRSPTAESSKSRYAKCRRNSAVDPAGGSGKKSRPSGGFKVEYKELGDPLDRSKYDRTTLTILINLDHPAVKNALKSGGMEDVSFRRLSYEIALTEYSIALGYEMAERDPDIPADDLLFEVRSTLNRVAAVAAALYNWISGRWRDGDRMVGAAFRGPEPCDAAVTRRYRSGERTPQR